MNAPGVSTATAHIQYELNEQHIYGSSRLGMHKADTVVCSYYTGYYYNGFYNSWQPMLYAPQCAPPTPLANYEKLNRLRGKRFYELTNHLGNVLATVTDRKLPKDITANNEVDYFEADVLSATDFYPFGMMQVGRSYSLECYRWGFGGQEKVDEIKGSGNHYSYTFREYDPRLGPRGFWSVDPLAGDYPELTPYQHSSLNPIWLFELEGLEGVVIGGADIFSEGKVSKETEEITTTVQQNLQAAGVDIPVQSFNPSAADAQATDITQTQVYQDALNFITENYNPEQPLVIYGYSFGGAVALSLQANLLKQDIEVSAFILVDATRGQGVETTPLISSNVKEAYNFYQTVSNPLGSRGYPAQKTFSSNQTIIYNKNLTSTIPNQPGQIPAWTPKKLQEKNKHGNIDQQVLMQAIQIMTGRLTSTGR